MGVGPQFPGFLCSRFDGEPGLSRFLAIFTHHCQRGLLGVVARLGCTEAEQDPAKSFGKPLLFSGFVPAFVFKYWNFFAENVEWLFAQNGQIINYPRWDWHCRSDFLLHISGFGLCD